MRDVIDRMGRALVVALAAPQAMRSKVRELLKADDENEVLREDLARAQGRRNEARELEAAATKAHRALISEVYALDTKIAVVTDELKITQRERDGFRADVQDLTGRLAANERACVELQCDLDTARAVRNDEQRFRLAAEGEVKRLREQLAEEQRGSLAVRNLLHAAERENERLTKALGAARAELAALRKPAEVTP